MVTTRTLAIDAQLVEGGRKCVRCGRAKPAEQFAWVKAARRRHSWCRNCHRLDMNEKRQTPEGKAKAKEYAARAEVKARKREWYAMNLTPEENRERVREYQSTPRGRMMQARRHARSRLRKATTDQQRERIQALIDRHTAALARPDDDDE